MIASKIHSFDNQTISDDQMIPPNATGPMESSEDTENDRQTFTSFTDTRGRDEPETSSLIQASGSGRSEIFEPKEKAMTARKKSTASNDINVERKESTSISEKASVDSPNHLYDIQQHHVIPETESTVNYDTNSYYENAEGQITDTAEATNFKQTDNSTFYQQGTEHEQYDYSYHEPQTQSYDEVQNINYSYRTTPYQNYEQQQQQNEVPANYQNYDQMNYATTYQSYDQQLAMSQDYAQQPIAMQNYDQQPTELSDYGTSQYDQSQGYNYNSYDVCTSSYVPTANNQNYASQTGSEIYPGIVKETSNDYGTQYNQQYTAENPPVSIHSDDYRSPVIPQYITPLFPAVISSELNPFSWEAQERAVATTATEPISQYVTQLSRPISAETYQQKEVPMGSDSDVQNAEEMKRKSPLRPAPPSPSVERSIPPTRPPMPLSPNLKYSTEPPSLHQKSSSKLAESESEDAWAQFKKLTERATTAVKSSEEMMKELEKTTVAKDIKDESYLAQIGGSQAYIPEQAYKQAREQKTLIAPAKEKKMKHGKSKKMPKPELTLAQEDDMDRAAMELAKKMAATRVDLQDWKPPAGQQGPSTPVEKSHEFSDETQEPNNSTWAGFDDSQAGFELPPSESGFFASASAAPVSPKEAFGDSIAVCGEVNNDLIDEDYDPFNVCSADDLVKEAKARVAAVIAAEETEKDINLFATTTKINQQKSDISSSTQEGGSPASSRPLGFDDEFRVEDDATSTPSPLYDEDDSVPLTDFPSKFTGDGWEMMIRYPIKKKIMSDRYWKPCYVRLRDNTLFMFNSKTEQKPFMEILLQ
ncbi:unnamed protein product, partial [Cercopithifilaria johnstoni]